MDLFGDSDGDSDVSVVDSDYSIAASFRRRISEWNYSYEERSESSDEDDFGDFLGFPSRTFREKMRFVQQNVRLRTLQDFGSQNSNMPPLDWYWLGSDISNNTHLENVTLGGVALGDHKTSYFFRGLTRSNTIKKMILYENGFSVAGVSSMVPFLQNSDSLNKLRLDDNNIQSEGINVLFRALRDSPIAHLSCNKCGIESIEINDDYYPRRLKSLYLYGNNINVDGCRGVAKLLQGRDATLKTLWLCKNKIDNEGVGILVHALQNNTSLDELDLRGNKVGDKEGITVEGMKLCLRLVNDITSIKATMQSNRTLQTFNVRILQYKRIGNELIAYGENVFQEAIDYAVGINMRNEDNPEAAGKEKVVQTQLHRGRRAELANLQGVDRSLYSELNPLHLPEVLALVGRHHGHGELHAALKSSIAMLFSTVNREECVKQLMEYHTAIIKEHESKIKALQAELATIKGVEIESRSIKRPRTEN